MAEWFARKYGNSLSNRITVRLAKLKPGDVLLDIGSGPGAAVREAARRLHSGVAIGVDPSVAMVKIARRLSGRHPARGRMSFRVGTAEHLPVEDRSISVALTINTLHHWARPKSGFAEVKRVLAPGGRIIITDNASKDGKCAHGHGPLSDPKAAVRLLKKSGFRNVRLSLYRKGGTRMFLTRANTPRPQ